MDKEFKFGRAQERRTRTPISFEDLGDKEALIEGDYANPQPYNLIRHPEQVADIIKLGLIRIDPEAISTPTELSRTIKHEAIHQLLQNQLKNKLDATAAPNYQAIAEAVSKRRLGNMPDEVPAYMGAYDKNQTNVPQDWRDQYINKLKESLLKINPGIAKQFEALTQ